MYMYMFISISVYIYMYICIYVPLHVPRFRMPRVAVVEEEKPEGISEIDWRIQQRPQWVLKWATGCRGRKERVWHLFPFLLEALGLSVRLRSLLVSVFLQFRRSGWQVALGSEGGREDPHQPQNSDWFAGGACC